MILRFAWKACPCSGCLIPRVWWSMVPLLGFAFAMFLLFRTCNGTNIAHVVLLLPAFEKVGFPCTNVTPIHAQPSTHSTVTTYTVNMIRLSICVPIWSCTKSLSDGSISMICLLPHSPLTVATPLGVLGMLLVLCVLS